MSAPSHVRAEATSLSTATIRWKYTGASAIAVYRSPDGTTWTEATTGSTRVAVGTRIYRDSELSEGTRYYYRLSDDAGATFSDIVTTITHGCRPPAVGGSGFSLPRMQDNDDPVREYNRMAQSVEDVLNARLINKKECQACPEGGAVVLNCDDGCESFVIIADQDINSITIEGCDDKEVPIDVIVPPNSTRGVCGWPEESGFSGDECFSNPIVTGPNSKTVSTVMSNGKARPPKSKPGTPAAGGSPGAGKGGTCGCNPVGGALTIKSCSPNNSLNCGTTKKLTLKVCGGRGPYNWSNTGGMKLKGNTTISGATAVGHTITVEPPINTGAAVVGTAYLKVGCLMTGPGPGRSNWVKQSFGCDDNALSGCDVQDWGCFANAGVGPQCFSGGVFSYSLDCIVGGTPGCNTAPVQAMTLGSCVEACDQRTLDMINNGCNPCASAAGGATVSVTDALGVTAVVLLNP